MTTALRTYRASYHPKDRNGYPVDNESGVLPSVNVKAEDAESAIRAAAWLTNCPIANVERLDPTEETDEVTQ